MEDNSDGGEGWSTIESDPGVFTELIQGMGVRGVQVDELFDISDGSEQVKELLAGEQTLFGLIFLFTWRPGGGSSGGASYSAVTPDPDIWFPSQVIDNACATQALLSILLNTSSPSVDLGETLTTFKSFTRDFPPDLKGLAMSNDARIRDTHNSFARTEPHVEAANEGSTFIGTAPDVYHYTAYLPIKGKLYELDGLKPGPVCLGDAAGAGTAGAATAGKGSSGCGGGGDGDGGEGEGEAGEAGEATPRHKDGGADAGGSDSSWFTQVRPAIQRRIEEYSTSEIRFSLMALVKDRTVVASDAIAEQRRRLTAVHEALVAHGVPMPTAEEMREATGEDEDVLHAAAEHKAGEVGKVEAGTVAVGAAAASASEAGAAAAGAADAGAAEGGVVTGGSTNDEPTVVKDVASVVSSLKTGDSTTSAMAHAALGGAGNASTSKSPSSSSSSSTSSSSSSSTSSSSSSPSSSSSSSSSSSCTSSSSSSSFPSSSSYSSATPMESKSEDSAPSAPPPPVPPPPQLPSFVVEKSKTGLKRQRDECLGCIERQRKTIKAEAEKSKRWTLENERRRHNYVPFLVAFVKLLKQNGKLQGMVQGVRRKEHERMMARTNR